MEKRIIVIPKNKSLKACKKILEKLIKNENITDYSVLDARGKDIPFFVNKLIQKGIKATGITGEDLFKEWQLNNPEEHLDIVKRYEWRDNQALFGKPILGLLGPKNKSLKDMPKNLSVAIADKYKKISKHFLNMLEDRGYKFEKIYLSGSVEEAYSYGLSDLVVDIIYSGKSAKEAGLEFYEKIFESDIVVIGKNEDFKEIPKITIKK